MMETPEQPAKRRKLSHEECLHRSEVSRAVSTANLAGKNQDSEHEWIRDESENAAKSSNAMNETDLDPDSVIPVNTTQQESSSIDVVQQNQHASPPQPLSKNQLKKLRKQQEWEAGKDFRKAKRKEKLLEKKARKREKAQKEKEERAARGLDPVTDTKSQPFHPVRLPITFLLDCGFDDKMTDKERISLGSQLTRSYSDNYRAPFQGQLVLSSWGGLLKERFDTVLHKHHQNWRGVKFTEEDFAAAASKAQEKMRTPQGGKLAGIFERYLSVNETRDHEKNGGHGDDIDEVNKLDQIEAAREQDTHTSNGHTTETTEQNDALQEQRHDQPLKASSSSRRPQPSSDLLSALQSQGEVIYLTADSPTTLTTLNPYSTYIIGGIVDKNRHKGICYKLAREAGIKTAKLPIGEFMEMQSRSVLATNHVVEIMVRYLECGDWGEAFMKVIPKRKGGKLKDDTAKEGEHDGGKESREGVDAAEKYDEDGSGSRSGSEEDNEPDDVGMSVENNDAEANV